jgi:hypothetical protein
VRATAMLRCDIHFFAQQAAIHPERTHPDECSHNHLNSD